MSSIVNSTYGEAVEDATGVSTLVGLLRLRAECDPARAAYTFLSDGEAEEACLTYAELDRRARSIAAGLQLMRARGERVLLVYPAGLDYVAAFFGCLYAGAVAVPAYPPRQNASFQRLQSIVEDARPAVALTTASILSKAKSKLAQWPVLESLRWVSTDGEAEDLSGEWREPEVFGDSLAFLQYTSGSTAAPKGVMVTHANLLHNEALIKRGFGQTSESVIAGWLPLYHDMGLIGNVLQALYSGARCVLMSPVAFLQSPFRWLSAISRYRATTSGGPNFAYELCVNKITAEQRALLDLSSWRVAFNGAEPVRAATLERFSEAFGPCGFRREAFRPCYGLAEATLLVSVSPDEAPPAVASFDTAELVNNRAAEVEPGTDGSRALVGCGGGLEGARVVVVDPDTLAPREDGRVGEIWVAGGSVARGYWDRPAETETFFEARLAATGEGPFLRTGDLGFKLGGELFITGRLKDLIIIRGLNHYPHDIELTAERSHGAVRPGCAAAFSFEAAGEERLALVLEVEPRFRGDAAEVLEAARSSVAREHEVQPHAVTLIRAGTLPKTSSGKIQRGACRAAFLEGSLNVVAAWAASDAGVAGGAREEVRPESLRDAKDVERWLVATLAARLGVEPSAVDASRSMLHYGLDSLTAVELAHDFEGALGVSLPMMSFLEESSIAEIAARAAAQLALRSDSAGDFCAPEEDPSARGLSYGQRTMWFLQQLAPESPAYNISVPMRVRGPLDAGAMRRAFESVAGRHECLRASFTEVEGEPVQRVLEGASVRFHAEDATAWGGQSVSDYLAEEALRPFDLSEGPLLRVSLLKVSGDEHVLQLVVHHIVADFWSLAIVMQELGAFYEAELTGVPAELAPLPMRYCDYASRQAESLAGARGARLRDYWRTQLAGELPALNLPYDNPRAAVQTYNGASEELFLDEGLAAALKEVGRANNATLYMTLLAAFQVLLHRYTGQEDLLVGTVTAGRGRPEWAGLVGYFVNPLTLRANLSEDVSFESFLRQSRRTALSAFEHQDYPFAALVEDLQPERDLSRSPIFHVMFVLQKAHLAGRRGLASFALGREGTRVPLADLTVESMRPPRQVAQYDLVMMMAEEGEGLAASLQYNADLFKPATVRRMLGHFRELLKSVAAEPARRVSSLNILPREERRQLLSEWNETGSPHTGQLVHRAFEAQAEKTPDALAVACGTKRLTYGELNERADVLAAKLRSLGVGPEVLVGVCLERSTKMTLAVLAVLKSGGAYVPLDPSHPAERLRLTLEDSGARALLTRRGLAPVFEGSGAEVIRLDSDWDAIAEEFAGAHAARVELTGENLAYMIYTSGSTGVPKGVAVRHAGLSNLVEWHRLAYGVTSGDRATLLAGPAFDASVWELWPYLTTGASLHVPEEATRASAHDLLKWLAAEGVTVSFLPTALAEAVMAEQMPADLALRVLLTGGDKLHRPPPEGLPYTFVNHYGPTEYTVVATRAAVAAGAESGGPPPIGRPIANTRVYLLDARLQVVPVGVAGELYIGGCGLARGYHARRGLTAERFIPDAYSGEPGARLYKTGDLARFLPDGQLEFIARADKQVKVRGFRVELGEIESALCRHASVLHAVVVAREEAAGDNRLVAYLVAEGGEVLNAEELRGFLKELLPEYMVPSAFVRLEELPLNANGKVDRKALPEPERPGADVDAAPPASPVEEILAGVWAQVLKAERVGASDNFFDLGGHSLLATQVVSRVRECFHVELPVRAIFESPTVAGLAAEVEKLLKAGQASAQARPVVPVLRDGKLPLSFAQQRLWFLDRLAPGNPLYNIPAAVRMKGSLDAAVLERSLGEIVRRHESLRTTFAAVEGRPVQVIAPAPATGLELIDLTGLAEGERDSEVERLADEEARKSFDLSTGPLLRASLLKLSEEEHVLLFTMHHIVSDGWSMGVLVGELKALYEAYSSGKESPLPEPTAQYADFAHWQRRALEDGLLEPELDYWRAQLRGAQSVLAMPTDRPRPPVQTYNGAAESFHIDEELTRSLKRLSLESGATLFMTLLAAFDALLYRHTNQRDISVATPVAGRTSAETEGLIGLFVNTLVMRARLEGAQSFRELLASVRETALAAYVHQGVPFEKLVEDLQPERDTSHSPLVQVMFAMQNAPAHALELPGLSLELMQPASVAAKFELLLTMEESAEGLAGRLEYNTDLFDPETAAALVARFRTLLAGAAADPDTEVAALPLLTFEERRRVLLEFNRTQRDYERATLHGLFEAQAARTPEATALVAGRERLTYRELNERAERVARGLRASGVGAESLVGVCAGRTAALVAGLLGVLKSGGAYVPLDPQYPAERVALMLEDSRAKVLLTERRLRGTLPQTGARVLCLDEEWAEFDEVARDENAAAFHSDENLSHVIYTSGSTGRPKGVAIMHRSSATLVRWALDTFAAEDLRGVLASTSICFDLSVYELFVPLATGGTVILADHALALPTLEARGEVTLINTVPSAMTELLRARAVPEGVRVVNLAGEPLAAKLVEDVYTQTGVRDVFNLYGPTEDTTYSTGERVPEGGGAPSIGRPVANTSGYILDAHLRPVPVGVTGDLYLSGEGLARGYLRRPDMTAERFIPDPFSTEPGARMYRTGDLARYLRDGRIDFLGRADHQVKIRGFRIELGEIESALSRTEGVRDCCVVARDEASGSKRLVAYLVAEPGADVSNAALRLSLRKTLPEYMVPSVFVMLEELPLTPNGKVDRKALPAPGGARPDDDGAYTAPRTPTEELVANVWRALLGLERVSVTENFFELGGHSLLATQAVAKVGEAARTELPLLMMFESPTVEGFAAAVDKLTAEAGEKRRGPSLTKFSRDAYRAKAPAGRGVEIPEILKRKRTE